MPQLRMPDGAVVAFPDDMPKEQIRAKILEKFPDAFTGQGALAARGAARGAAGMLADANAVANTPVLGSVAGALFPPVQALRLASGKPGGKPGEQDPHTAAAMGKIEQFANAATPSGAERMGWLASQALPALFSPATGVERMLAGAVSSRLVDAAAQSFSKASGVVVPDAVKKFLASHGWSLAKHAAGHAGVLGERAGTRVLARPGAQVLGRTVSSDYATDRRTKNDSGAVPQNDQRPDAATRGRPEDGHP